MRPPKKIYLELNNVPSCNFGALWYEEPVEGSVAHDCFCGNHVSLWK